MAAAGCTGMERPEQLKIYYQTLKRPEKAALMYGVPRNIAEQTKVVVYSGSWNPLHEGHKYILKLMYNNAASKVLADCIPFWELSICPRFKDPLSFEDLQTRVGQFYTPGILTNCQYFSEKADHIRLLLNRALGIRHPNLVFILGSDTAVKVLEDHEKEEIEGIDAHFWVVDRNGGNQALQVLKRSDCLPGNFKLLDLDTSHLKGISSSKIRAGEQT